MTHCVFRTFTCTQKWREIEGVYSFIFAPDNCQAIDFKPGQFVLLKSIIGTTEVVRCYSIASLPGQAFIKLTVQTVKDGIMSSWLNQHLDVGAQIEISNPIGGMTLDHVGSASSIIMASAGCGIVPLMAMLRAALTTDSTRMVYFIHCAKDEDNIIYKNELLELDSRYDNLILDLYLKTPSTCLSAKVSRFGVQEAARLRHRFDDSVVYLCGSDKFTSELSQHFSAAGVLTSQMYSESYGGKATAHQEPKTVSVSMPMFNHHMVVERGTDLMEVLHAMHVPEPGGYCQASAAIHYCRMNVEVLATGDVEVVNACQYPIERDIRIMMI
ncbi:ferredoxin--NADP reductase [Thaumasiovibrio sp. DFM-14]|uniref:ferredoxin--NADP reductase n=1 Tax=Thaumasiovibrio sp. DFM-14 TaxID=3384792 RepID=UPI00399FD4D3